MTQTLVILAAGLGSRYGGAKQTAAVGPSGEWLLDYGIFDAFRAGFTDIVIVIRPGAHAVFEPVLARWQDRVRIHLVEQRPDDLPPGTTPGARTKPWGTGHALRAARGAVGGAFAMINGDDFYGRDAYALGAGAIRAADDTLDATIVGMPLDATLSPHGAVTRAICDVEDGRVIRVREVRGIVTGGPAVVSMNFWVFPQRIFAELERGFAAFLRDDGRDPTAEFLIPEFVNGLIARKALTVRVVQAPGPWLGLTHPDDYQNVVAGLRALTRDGVYATPLWDTESNSRGLRGPRHS